MRRIRLCVVVTIDLTLLNLCRGRFEYFIDRGFDVSVVCAPTCRTVEIENRGVRLHTVPLSRAITPLRDLGAIWRLFRLFRRERFDIVEYSTPKAALVGSIAATLARVPRTLHLLRGLAYEGQRGLRRMLLKISQTVPCRLADEVISISRSMMKKAVQDGVCRQDKIRVLGSGSSNGVDLRAFTPPIERERQHAREALGLPPSATVAGFVGRITLDKGIRELVGAFKLMAAGKPDLHLVLVGDYEHRDRPPEDIVEFIASHSRVRHVGWQQETVPYYSAMDFLVLPTHREGFGTVLLEAAAMGIPTITTDIPGCRDAVDSDKTALLVPSRDTAALANAMARMVDDPALRARLGSNGRRRAEALFAQEHVWRLQEEALRRLLEVRANAVARGQISR